MIGNLFYWPILWRRISLHKKRTAGGEEKSIQKCWNLEPWICQPVAMNLQLWVKIETESIQTLLTLLIWSGAENRLLLKGLCNFPYKRIENEQNEKRAVLNMFLLPGYEMFQPLQEFRNTLFKMKILKTVFTTNLATPRKKLKSSTKCTGDIGK